MSKILQVFSAMGYMDESNRSIVLYGMQRIKNLSIDFLISAICGLLMENVLVGILFEATFIPLRIYAGGYHAHNERVCKMVSWSSIAGGIAIIRYLPISLNMQHILMGISIVGIMMFAPVESKNKPLSRMEKDIFRIRAIVIVLVNLMIYIVLSMDNFLHYSKTICMAVVLVAGGMVLEVVDNRMKEKVRKANTISEHQ